MTPKTFEFLEAVLQNGLNQIIAQKEYLTHQETLQPMHRVYDGDPDQLEDELNTLKKYHKDYEKAIASFKANKLTLLGTPE